MKPIEE